MVCKLKMMVAGATIGRSCPECSHIDLLHPGDGQYNKDIKECLLCRIVEHVNEVEWTTRGSRDRITFGGEDFGPIRRD